MKRVMRRNMVEVVDCITESKRTVSLGQLYDEYVGRIGPWCLKFTSWARCHGYAKTGRNGQAEMLVKVIKP